MIQNTFQRTDFPDFPDSLVGFGASLLADKRWQTCRWCVPRVQPDAWSRRRLPGVEVCMDFQCEWPKYSQQVKQASIVHWKLWYIFHTFRRREGATNLHMGVVVQMATILTPEHCVLPHARYMCGDNSCCIRLFCSNSFMWPWTTMFQIYRLHRTATCPLHVWG